MKCCVLSTGATKDATSEALKAIKQEEQDFEKQYKDWMKQYSDWKDQNKSEFPGREAQISKCIDHIFRPELFPFSCKLKVHFLYFSKPNLMYSFF